MIIAIAADHAGFALKSEILDRLASSFYFLDLGAKEYVADDDYTDYALAVAQAVIGGKAEKGIVICGSGIGACIAANKVVGVRASVCHDMYSAHQGVEHDNLNVICLGANVIGVELALELVQVFISSCFLNEEPYVRRLHKLFELEDDTQKRP